MKIILNRHPGWRHNVHHCHHNSHNTALSERTLCNIQIRKLTFAKITIGKIIQNDHKYHHGHGNHDNLTIYLVINSCKWWWWWRRRWWYFPISRVYDANMEIWNYFAYCQHFRKICDICEENNYFQWDSFIDFVQWNNADRSENYLGNQENGKSQV